MNQKITFSIKGIDYTIKDVTISQYYEIYEDILVDDTSAHFNICSKLSGCDLKALKTLKPIDWQLLWASIVGMLNSYFNKDLSTLNQEIEHNGIRYGLINPNKMTIGEYADLDVITSSDTFHKRYHEILAILYRPILRKNIFTKKIQAYEDTDLEEQSEIFKELPLYHVQSALSFFLLLGKESTGSIKTYLEKIFPKTKTNLEEDDQLKKAISELLEAGGELLTPSLKNNQFNLVKLPSLQSEKDSTGSPGKRIRSEKKKKQSKEQQN